MGRDQCMVWGSSEKARLREKFNRCGKPLELQPTNLVNRYCQAWYRWASFVAIWFLVRVGEKDNMSIIKSWLSCRYQFVRLSFKTACSKVVMMEHTVFFCVCKEPGKAPQVAWYDDETGRHAACSKNGRLDACSRQINVEILETPSESQG